MNKELEKKCVLYGIKTYNSFKDTLEHDCKASILVNKIETMLKDYPNESIDIEMKSGYYNDYPVLCFEDLTKKSDQQLLEEIEKYEHDNRKEIDG